MKFVIVLFSCIACMLLACSKKSLPVIVAREPAITNEAISPSIKPDIETGRIIFNTRCNRCHMLPDLLLYNQKKWESILRSMAPKARLNQEQKIHVAAYINAQTGK